VELTTVCIFLKPLWDCSLEDTFWPFSNFNRHVIATSENVGDEYKNKPTYSACGVYPNHKDGIKTAYTKRIITVTSKLDSKLCSIKLATQPNVTWCKIPRMVHHFHFSFKSNVLKIWYVYITRCQGWEISNSVGPVNKEPYSVDIRVATQKFPKLKCRSKIACSTESSLHPTPRYVLWIISDLPKIQHLACDTNDHPII